MYIYIYIYIYAYIYIYVYRTLNFDEHSRTLNFDEAFQRSNFSTFKPKNVLIMFLKNLYAKSLSLTTF